MNRSGCCLRHLSQKYKCQLGPSSNVIWNHQSSCVPFIPFILSKTSYFKSPCLLLIPILLAQWPGRNHWFHSSHCHGRPGSFWSLQYLWPIYDTIRVFVNLFDSQIRGQICKLFQPPNAVDDLNQVIEEVLESIGFISCSREFWKMVLKFDEICGDPNIIHHFYNKSDVCVVWKEVYPKSHGESSWCPSKKCRLMGDQISFCSWDIISSWSWLYIPILAGEIP